MRPSQGLQKLRSALEHLSSERDGGTGFARVPIEVAVAERIVDLYDEDGQPSEQWIRIAEKHCLHNEGEGLYLMDMPRLFEELRRYLLKDYEDDESQPQPSTQDRSKGVRGKK